MNPRLLNTIHFVVLLLGVLFVLFGWFSFLAILCFWILYILFFLIVSTNVQFNFFVKAYNNNSNIRERHISLTFDDGPVENTLKTLEVLDRYQVKAAFFCIGKNIEKNPEIFERIIERGHIVGNHSFSHTPKMGFSSSNKVLEEIMACDKIVEEKVGLKMKLFRPPFGVTNPEIQMALDITGHKIIGWNLRSYDGILNSKDFILKRIRKRIKPGDVILLHDNKKHSAEILEQLLLFLRENQYQVVRPDQLFEIDAYS